MERGLAPPAAVMSNANIFHGGEETPVQLTYPLNEERASGITSGSSVHLPQLEETGGSRVNPRFLCWIIWHLKSKEEWIGRKDRASKV